MQKELIRNRLDRVADMNNPPKVSSNAYTKDDLLSDVILVTGVMASSILLVELTPFAYKCAHKLAGMTLRGFLVVKNTVGTKLCKIRVGKRRGNLIRWIGTNLPQFCFPSTQRIHVLLQGMQFDAAKEILMNRTTGKKTDIMLDYAESINSDGECHVVIPRAPSTVSLDTEECLVEDELYGETEVELMASAIDENVNTGFTCVQFEPGMGCSTPNRANDISDWIPNVQGSGIVNTVSSAFQNSILQATKIAKLNDELEQMKLMMSQLMKMNLQQCQLQMSTFQIQQQDLSSSVCQDESENKIAPLVPPPPPPPPLPPAPVLGDIGNKILKRKSTNSMEIELKKCQDLKETEKIPKIQTDNSNFARDLVHELSKAKLTKTEMDRSPGGTPIKPKNIFQHSGLAKPLIPTEELIKLAIHKRFMAMNPVEEEDEDNKENASFSEGEDPYEDQFQANSAQFSSKQRSVIN